MAELVVITRSNNKALIEAALPVELKAQVRFEYYDLPNAIRRLKRKEKGLYPYYILWQWGAYRLARELLREEKFDYVMHLTFGSIWMPTFMHRLPLPFIWGPVGGGEVIPFGLISSMPLRSRLLEYLRYGLIATYRINPLFILVTRRARIILARTEETAQLIPSRHAGKVRVVLETAISNECIEAEPTNDVLSDGIRPIQVIYTGRLVAQKNVATAIHAVAIALRQGVDLHLRIVGDGPQRVPLETLARREGVAEQVTFTGMISRPEVLAALRISDVYLLPSLKEGGTWSLMEAMSMALPVVCLNTSGMAVIADTESAVMVQPVSQTQMINDFSVALEDLATSPERRIELGRQARRRIEENFRWQHKADFMAGLLDELEQKSS